MNPTPDPAAAGTPEDWLRHAESDLRIAKLARQDLEVLPNQIAFHAQQASEKAMKGVLVRCKIEFPRTHHLEELSALVQEAGVSWPFDMDQVEALAPYAVQTRYPGCVQQISRDDLDQAIEMAEQVLAWAREEVGKTSEAGAELPDV